MPQQARVSRLDETLFEIQARAVSPSARCEDARSTKLTACKYLIQSR